MTGGFCSYSLLLSCVLRFTPLTLSYPVYPFLLLVTNIWSPCACQRLCSASPRWATLGKLCPLRYVTSSFHWAFSLKGELQLIVFTCILNILMDRKRWRTCHYYIGSPKDSTTIGQKKVTYSLNITLERACIICMRSIRAFSFHLFSLACYLVPWVFWWVLCFVFDPPCTSSTHISSPKMQRIALGASGCF